jgi:hypothetical protein
VSSDQKIVVLRSCCKNSPTLLKNSKTFRLFKNLSICIYGPDIEIFVSEFTTFESVNISISVPKTIEITKVNKPNLFNYIRKKCPMLGSN